MIRRWGIAEYLGAGLAILITSIGLFILGGVWILTQRDAAFLAADPSWIRWDWMLSLWAYGILLFLLLLSVGVALWWWRSLARPFLRVRDRLRSLLWEGISQRSAPKPVLVEAQELSQTTDTIEEVLSFLHQLARGERQEAPPILAEWPPAIQQLAKHLLQTYFQNQQAAALRGQLLDDALYLLRLSQQARSVESYLAKAGPIFLQSIGAAMGAFYRLEGEKLRRLYSYAYPSDAPQEFLIGEGWIGQVARQGQALWLSTLPQGYLQALSGLGKAPPQAIALLPVIAAESIRGVWDLATFTEWDATQQHIAETLLPFFAIGYLLQEESEKEHALSSEKAYLHSLLATLEQKLQATDHEAQALRKNIQDLEQQIAEAQANSHRLEKRLFFQQRRWDAVISHISEAVVLFDATGRPRYLSPAVRQLLGYSEEELQVFFRPVDKADAERVRQYFHQLITHTSNGVSQSLRFRYHHKDGRLLWLEAKGQNYLSEPGIEAILLILRDITDEIEYEKQYRTRLKFQSLVENSPDIIFRTDREGNFLYVNPTIERYTGYSPSHYIRNTIYSVGFSLEEMRFWERFIYTLFETLTIQSAEIDFPSVYGVRRMAVRGIPEVSPDGSVETMVILLQDITELRQAQEQLRQQNLRLEEARRALEAQKQELEEKNRDIMESIAYARRIQGAVLPGEAGLQRFFPESFVLHILRDVVGGDFYWCGEVSGQRIVAVVDCTGHGVPGAFMTFLGYTLLESAVRDRGLFDPAQILYYMDGRLRQLLSGQEAMQDGMDIAICSIDPQRQILRFAGAHRPLFLFQDGRWQLIPGTAAGLGGAPWLDKVKLFTTHTFSYQHGDLVYLYTDGFADQFSADGKRRYTHRRLRQLLMTWSHLPMADQHKKLSEALSEWMGENSPTDDITVIGLRL